MSNDPVDKNTQYLPERYRQHIQAKKQRRFWKKILITCAGIAILALVVILLIGTISGILQNALQQQPIVTVQSPQPSDGSSPAFSPASGTDLQTPNETAGGTRDFILGPGIPTKPTYGMVSLDTAIASLRLDYPAPEYAITRVNITNISSGTMFEFRIRPAADSTADSITTVFIDATTAEPYTPGQENAKISAEQAKTITATAFSARYPDQMRVRYSDSDEAGKVWNFNLYKDNTTFVTGSLDPETGEITSFTRRISPAGRPADPVLDLLKARSIANRYISDHNGGPLPLNMTTSRYEPLGTPENPSAGQYIFQYKRMFRDIPCDTDGFFVNVDSVSGEVTGYQRRWATPEYAFSVLAEPLITKREATFAIMQKAKEVYPESVENIRIISADIMWMTRHKPGTIPRPGSIPLGWVIQFDDDVIRTNLSSRPAVGWIDVQTGAILDFSYRH